ncbi:MAG: efflux RND transporter permease subunit [Candidatus Sumerlaeia bacterium]|nr:efflux RND transporter permease subunit [Candidatus Sumerlaeia bacterium]
MIRYFLNNGIAVAVLCITIMLFGVLALFSIPVQLTPNVREPAITVSTIFPGASPEDVEQDILIEQERFLRSVPGLKKMTSNATFGQGEIILEFSVGSDQSENLVRVNNALAQVASYPENVDQPAISTTSSADQPVGWFSIRAAEGMEAQVDIQAQFNYVEDFVKPRFERIPGVASIQGVYGGSPKEMQLFIDPTKLAERGITIYQVREAVRLNNRDVSGGDLYEGKRRYNVRTLGRVRTPQDLENTIITVRDGVAVYIRDVGYAALGTAKQRSLIRHNGRPALAMGVRHEPGTNLLVVMDEVKRVAIEVENEMLAPRNLRITQVTDDTEYVREATEMVYSNLFSGGALSLVVLMMFLRHLRSTAIVGVAVPLCIAGSLFMINALGRTINVISLAGLAFSVGSVLDCSIVVLENIFRHREMGKGPYKAAEDGIEEVWSALLSGTLTNVIVFLPIITLKEQAGQLFKDIAIAITATNLLALLVAVLVVPCLAYHLLHKLPEEPKHAGLRRNAYNLFGLAHLAGGWLRMLERLLTYLMRSTARRLAVVGGVLGLSILLIFVFMPKTEYLPDGNQNTVFGLMIPPQGYNIDELSAVGAELESRIRPYVEGTPEQFEAGELDGPPIKDFFFVGFGANIFIFSRAQDPSHSALVPDLLTRYFNQVPGMFGFAQQVSIFESDLLGSRGVDLDIIGTDYPMITGVAAQAFVKTMMLFGEPPRPQPGIEIGQPQLTIRPNWLRAAESGVSSSSIGYGAWVLGDGAYVDDYYEDGRKYDIYMYSTLGALDTLTNFDALRIATDTGSTVPIADVATFGFDFVPEAIRRVDQQRAVTLGIAPPQEKSLEEGIDAIRNEIVGKMFEEGLVPPGVELRIGGSSDKLTAIRDALSGDIFLALALVYMVMVLIFHHWGHPFTILLSIPVGMSGGVIGLKFINLYLAVVQPGQIQSLDVLTMLGFFILLGSVVNNPILVVEQTLNFERQGMDRHDAAVKATLSRVRPILMTTGTTILGLAPLVLIPGAGSELYRGLGIVMFGGLLLGTITTLFFIPSVMTLLQDAAEKFADSRLGQRASTVVTKLEEG